MTAGPDHTQDDDPRGHRPADPHGDQPSRATGLYRYVADLGTVRITVTADHLDLFLYLKDFYTLTSTDDSTPPDWTIHANLAEPLPGMALTPWNVGYQSTQDTQRTTINSTDRRDLAITVRKAIREVLLDYCENRRYAMLHASAIATDDHVIIVVGDKGSGKTTLALNGALAKGYQYLSNDHLILYRTDTGLVLTSLPTPIPVKIGTYLDYAEQLGDPWENDGVVIEAYRTMTAHQRYHQDERLLVTYQRLGQPHPLHTALTGRKVIVVLASYADCDQPAGVPTPVTDPAAALWSHVRFDWVFDPQLNTRHLPRDARDRDQYSHDAHARLTDLIGGATVVDWRHHGRLAPLLDWISALPGAPR